MSSLFDPGEGEVNISLKGEPKTFREVFGEGFIENTSLDLELRTVTYSFSPRGGSGKNQNLYWGYLIQILDYKIRFDGYELEYQDVAGEQWSSEKEEIQKEMITRFLELSKKKP